VTSIARIKEFRDKRPLEFGLGDWPGCNSFFKIEREENVVHPAFYGVIKSGVRSSNRKKSPENFRLENVHKCLEGIKDLD
jgi:hypothetical protein